MNETLIEKTYKYFKEKTKKMDGWKIASYPLSSLNKVGHTLKCCWKWEWVLTNFTMDLAWVDQNLLWNCLTHFHFQLSKSLQESSVLSSLPGFHPLFGVWAQSCNQTPQRWGHCMLHCWQLKSLMERTNGVTLICYCWWCLLILKYF